MQDESRAGITFKSKEAKYVLFNFHREKNLAAMTALLRSMTDEPHIVALAGEIGCGRRYFLEAALYRVQAAGEKVHQSAIDLDGYELEKGSLERFVLHQIAKRAASGESYASNILEQSKLNLMVQGPSIWGISLASIALSLDVPLKEALSQLARTFESIPGPERTPREGLSRLIRSLTRTHKLVLHVVDSAAITTSLRGMLVDEARVNRNLILVFSCGASDRSEAIAPRVSEVIRFELKPLNKQELRAAIDQRFSPNTFPDWLYAALWDYSRGVPGRLALKIADLLGGNFLVEDSRTGAWHLSEGDPLSYDLAQELGPDAYEPIRKVLSALPASTAECIEAILQLSALCGDKIPVRLLLAHIMLAEDKRDEYLDLIDDIFAENPVFDDLGYRYPGFSGELIYSFSNPILRSVILERVPGARRSQLALNLLSFLQQNLPVLTRGVAQLFLEIARHLDSDRERERYEQELAWWIGLDEAEEFSEYLRRAVRDGRLAPVAVLAEQGRSKMRWPPYKSLAILNALVADDREAPILPVNLLGMFYFRRAEARYISGLYAEALDDASLGLRASEGDPQMEAALHSTIGSVKHRIGDYKEAHYHLNRALVLHDRELGPDHAEVATDLNNLGLLYDDQSQHSEAERLLKQALAIRERVLGMEHPYFGQSLSNLAMHYYRQGRYAEAIPLCKQGLAIRERALGPSHLELATNLHNLALLYGCQGQYSEAEPLCKRAMAMREDLLGPEHPDRANSLSCLAWLYSKQGKNEEVESLYQRSLAILEKGLGADHPDLGPVLMNYAQFMRSQGQHRAAEELQSRAQAIFQKDC
jgi:tetratricopeptide (TPR) repeat protein